MAHHNDKLDKALGCRNCCVLGLCAAWVTGFAGIIGGCYCIYLDNFHTNGGASNKAQFIFPRAAKEVLPLGLNIVVTFLNEAMGYIHSTSLRWSLQYENRLTFNSNLRLLSSAKRSRPNAWWCNIAFLICIILSYATTSLIFLGYNTTLGKTLDGTKNNTDLENIIQVSGVALIIFGISLLGQASLATWALRTTKIPTWYVLIPIVNCCFIRYELWNWTLPQELKHFGKRNRPFTALETAPRSLGLVSLSSIL
jgi:hypothetical protein